MEQIELRKILKDFKAGRASEDDVLTFLKRYGTENLAFAHIDHHRSLRKGFPEVVFCQGKTNEQLLAIIKAIHARNSAFLATRATRGNYEYVCRDLRGLIYLDDAKIITTEETVKKKKKGAKKILVISAGTSDIPVAEEAAVTVEAFGNRVERVFDVGIAGIHRLFEYMDSIQKAYAIIVVAGMEGALASVVGGLTDKPVIAVPTSVGYGASFKGVAALLAMLNSCASGVTVVNIDNGFGAGYAASLIARTAQKNV
ncbi:nickel pincer cofactor biosynthesis protein LarB [candidate division KSB1 bacterium]